LARTQAGLDTIDQAIDNLVAGKRRVKFVLDGELVEYATVDLPQLRAFRKEYAADVVAADQNATIAFKISGSKGL